MRKVNRKTTIYDIAKLVGVTAGTVSRALNGASTISAEKKKQIAIAARQLNFAPKKRFGVIAVSVQGPLNDTGYYARLVVMITWALKKYGYIMQPFDGEKLDYLQAISVDAVIELKVNDKMNLREILPPEFNIPVITINNPHTEFGFHSFRTDHRKEGYAATKELLEFGHTRIAFLEAEGINWGSKERLAGYCDALKEAGIPFDPKLVCYSFTTKLHDIVENLKIYHVTGVVNCSAEIALDFNHYVCDILKMRIPDDFSVVTIELSSLQRFMSPPQTVIHQPLEELVEQVVRNLDEIIHPSKPGKIFNYVANSTIIRRNSVKVMKDGR